MIIMLYFIKSGNYCKIGYSRDQKALFTRLRNYLTHNPFIQILDLRKGDMITESHIHSLIPLKLYHHGEWCVWNKEIAKLWLSHYNVQIEEPIEEYFIKRNKIINKAIVQEYNDTIYLNFIRYFRKESNLDLSEPDATVWRVP